MFLLYYLLYTIFHYLFTYLLIISTYHILLLIYLFCCVLLVPTPTPNAKTLSLKQTSRVLNGDVIIDFNATSSANEHYVFFDDSLADSALIRVLLHTRPNWKRTRIITDAALIFTSQPLNS